MSEQGIRIQPFGLQWHITNKCDQCCKHCYIWREERKTCLLRTAQSRELDFEQCCLVVEKFISFCEEFRVSPVINITGGDPILSSFFWELLEYFNQRNIPFRVLGNPFHLDNRICERLKRLGCIAYQMSLDGLQKIHDFIRKKGSFKATLRAIELLKNAGIRVVIMSTVSRLNYQDMPGLARLVVDRGVNVYDFARYCPRINEVESQFSPLEYKDFLSRMWEVFSELADRGTAFPLKDHLWTLWLWERGLFQVREEKMVFQGCNCGISHLTLLPDGIIYACRRFESPVGNILDQSFEEIFLGTEMEKYRQIDKLEGCKDCELLNYCRGCHAVSYGLYGNFFAKDPQCWRFIGSGVSLPAIR